MPRRLCCAISIQPCLLVLDSLKKMPSANASVPSFAIYHATVMMNAPNYLLGKTTVTRQNKVRTEFLLVA